MGFCTKCGSPIADGAAFCTTCGQPSGPQQMRPNTAPPAQQNVQAPPVTPVPPVNQTPQYQGQTANQTPPQGQVSNARQTGQTSQASQTPYPYGMPETGGTNGQGGSTPYPHTMGQTGGTNGAQNQGKKPETKKEQEKKKNPWLPFVIAFGSALIVLGIVVLVLYLCHAWPFNSGETPKESYAISEEELRELEEKIAKKEATAVEEENAASSVTNSTPRKPISAESGSITAGISTSRPAQAAISSRRCADAPLMRKNAPSRNSVIGLAARDMSRAASSTGPGSRKPVSRHRTPAAVPRITRSTPAER